MSNAINQALETIAQELRDRTGVEFTVGYIGNVERDGDHRLWCFFAPHPGRVGTSADSWGGVGLASTLVTRANRHYEALVRWAEGVA